MKPRTMQRLMMDCTCAGQRGRAGEAAGTHLELQLLEAGDVDGLCGRVSMCMRTGKERGHLAVVAQPIPGRGVKVRWGGQGRGGGRTRSRRA